MLFLIVLTVVAVAVAVGALQNGHPVIGGVIGFARFVRRWSYRQAVRLSQRAPADPGRLRESHPPAKCR